MFHHYLKEIDEKHDEIINHQIADLNDALDMREVKNKSEQNIAHEAASDIFGMKPIADEEDNVDNEMLQENKFYLVLGPEDIKLNIGYDTVRQRSTFQFQIMLGGSGQDNNIDFKKLIINDPDKLGQGDEWLKFRDKTKLKFIGK